MKQLLQSAWQQQQQPECCNTLLWLFTAVQLLLAGQLAASLY
jgi:hypothetical protein